ncbi:8128_t:CDS:2 [Entrophospora sp. SA101]|nr:8128_t:CDS:2 [Entrophospora sp. SA101]
MTDLATTAATVVATVEALTPQENSTLTTADQTSSSNDHIPKILKDEAKPTEEKLLTLTRKLFLLFFLPLEAPLSELSPSPSTLALTSSPTGVSGSVLSSAFITLTVSLAGGFCSSPVVVVVASVVGFGSGSEGFVDSAVVVSAVTGVGINGVYLTS